MDGRQLEVWLPSVKNHFCLWRRIVACYIRLSREVVDGPTILELTSNLELLIRIAELYGIDA